LIKIVVYLALPFPKVDCHSFLGLSLISGFPIYRGFIVPLNGCRCNGIKIVPLDGCCCNGIKIVPLDGLNCMVRQIFLERIKNLRCEKKIEILLGNKMYDTKQPQQVSNTMSAMIVTVNKRVNAGMKELAKEVSKQTIATCAAKYGFAADEMLDFIEREFDLKGASKAKKAASDSDGEDAPKKKGGRPKMTEEEKEAAAEKRKEAKKAAKIAEREQKKAEKLAAAELAKEQKKQEREAAKAKKAEEKAAEKAALKEKKAAEKAAAKEAKKASGSESASEADEMSSLSGAESDDNESVKSAAKEKVVVIVAPTDPIIENKKTTKGGGAKAKAVEPVPEVKKAEPVEEVKVIKAKKTKKVKVEE